MLYYIQECYNDGTIHEEWSCESEWEAKDQAVRAARSFYFEADYVRVITQDSELVWDSRNVRIPWSLEQA